MAPNTMGNLVFPAETIVGIVEGWSWVRFAALSWVFDEILRLEMRGCGASYPLDLA